MVLGKAIFYLLKEDYTMIVTGLWVGVTKQSLSAVVYTS